ncbi:hypothetical protein C0991_007662 [Blastosporella zonata]|nr:hypothetical protein C0991_007662 [Blastosporella zonata]
MAFTTLPEDVLLAIFLLAQTTHTVRGPQPRVALSHVSRKCRHLATSSPELWSHIRITPETKIEALRVFLSRAEDHDLDIIIRHHPLHRHSISRTIRPALLLAGSLSHCWKHLSITGSASALYIDIMSVMKNLRFPRLQSFEVIQTMPKSVLHLGPFKFDSRCLKTVRLRAVNIYLSDPADFAGLRTLDLGATSCQAMLDQVCMDNQSAVDAPRPQEHRPHMVTLRRLSIRAIVLEFPLRPSIDPSSIVSLTLGGFHGFSPASIPVIVHLFHKLSGPNLRDLELDGILTFAWQAFILFLHTTADIPKYPHVKTLVLRSLTLGALDMYFGRAFPEISRLELIKLNSQPIRTLMRNNPLLWPDLFISVDEN